jgi:hypothetical protein
MMILVIGDHGSRMMVVDVITGVIVPPNGLDLASIGLRASGLAGATGDQTMAGPRLSCLFKRRQTRFHFSAFLYDEHGAVVDERIMEVSGAGLRAGLSIDGLREEFGTVSSLVPTSADTAFVEVRAPQAPSGPAQLWYVDGEERTMIDWGEAFGGMDASGDTVVYVVRRDPAAGTALSGGTYEVEVWCGDCGYWERDLPESPEPIFYPFLTPNGKVAVSTQLDPGSGQAMFATTPCDSNPCEETWCFWAGQGEVTDDALAHYDQNGLTIVPLPPVP